MQTNFIVNAEVSVISSILFDQSNLTEISSILKPTDIYLPAHRDIYETILVLHKQDMPIDESFIINKSSKKIDESILLQIVSALPISNVMNYVNALKQASIKRQLQSFALELQKNSGNENVSTDDIFDLIKDRQEDIRLNGVLKINKNSILDIKEQEPEFYIKHWLPIPLGTITILSAPGGTGKTWLIVQLSLRFIIENPNKKAFLWLSEDLESITKNRMNQVCSNILSNTLDDKFKNIVTTDSNPLPLLERDKGVFKMSSRFEQLKVELRDYDLIVLDPLLAFYGGDENDNSQARLFMQPFMNWAKETNKSIIFLHHSSKSVGNEGANKTRGAGAFVDAARVCYEMNKIYLKDNKTLDIDNLHMRDIRLSKDNYGAIKHFKKFNNMRHITPTESSRNFTDIEFIEII